jgi:Flp pilus assembly protein TadG
MTCQVRRTGSRRGSTLVEFSLSAFLLVMVMLSTFEFTRMLLVYTTVANAARGGARYAIVHGGTRSGAGVDGPSSSADHSQVDAIVRDFASTGALDVSNLSITVSYPTDNKPGSLVIVTAVYPYDPFLGWFNRFSGFTLGSTSRGVITF